MASYANFLGRKVTVSYRIGDVLLPASGTFVGDSGRSIFLEQHVEQRGRRNYFRWEIPYQYIHRIHVDELPAAPALESTTPTEEAGTTHDSPEGAPARPSSMAARAASGASGLLPLSHRPKTA